MKKKIERNKYEVFHKDTSVQTSIIDSKNFTYRTIIDQLNKYLKKKNHVLDIGCGAGVLSLYLAHKGNTVDAIDISQKSIDTCKQSAEELNLEKKVFFKKMNFPYESPSKKYDFILFIEVIEHLKDDNLALKNLFQLLKPKGLAIISTPSKNAPLYKLGLAENFDRRVGHLRRYTLNELINKCENVGFKILEAKKTEGIIRNFLYLNSVAGKFIRFIKYFISDLVMLVDQFSIKIFGESDLFIIVQKP